MSSDDVMRLGKFDNNDITETLLDYCDCGGHGCEPCYAAEVIKRLRAENDDMQVLLRGRTAELQAEVERLRAENDAYRQVYVDEAEFLEAFANWDGTRENLPFGWKWEQWDKKNEQ